jgi:HEAT repeat protein
MGLVKASAPRETVSEPELGADELVGLLGSSERALRRFAAGELRRFPERAPEIGGFFPYEQDKATRDAMLITLVSVGNAEACGALIAVLPFLNAENADLRNEVIEALEQMPAGTAPMIAALLGHGDADLRIFGVNILKNVRHGAVPGWLCELMRGEAHRNVVAAAIDALAEIGSPEMIPDLVAAARRFPDDRFLSFAAGVAIEQISAGDAR